METEINTTEILPGAEKRRQIIEKWQKLLHLEGWKILSTLADDTKCEEMGECDAVVEYNTTHQKAWIYIKPQEKRRFDESIEVTILHEILHLYFAFFPYYEENSIEGRYFDSLIQRLAEVLAVGSWAV